ncbi:MAG: hypothetical protein Fues2KO_28110 [Fuerstiella sp.]
MARIFMDEFVSYLRRDGFVPRSPADADRFTSDFVANVLVFVAKGK